jgi:hypothetical protein
MGEVAAGRWWKFNRYQVVDGYIRPARKAALDQFDPWSGFSYGPDKRVGEPPYVQLGNLLNRLPTPSERDERMSLSADQESELLDWCSRYGLLGLLPDMAELVEITTRPEPDEEEGHVNVLAITMRRYGDEWLCHGDSGRVRAEHVPPPRSRVLVNPAWGPEPHFEPLSKTWAGFFPDVPSAEKETYPYPTPLTREFWRQYAEPVVDFVRVGKYLADAVTRLNNPEAQDFPDIFGVTMTEERALWFLNRLIQSTAPVLQPDNLGNLQRTWRSPSLLGTLAMMATEDRLGDRRLYQCECGRQVASSYPNTRYCSPEHREKYRKRAQREKERKSKKGSGGGRARGSASRKPGSRAAKTRGAR